MSAYLIIISLVFISVALNTAGQTLLKAGAGQGLVNIHLLGGIVAYGLSTVSYILILKKLNVVVAYPVVFGLTIIATTLAGTLILKEQVTNLHWIGVGLIISGLCAIAFGKIS